MSRVLVADDEPAVLEVLSQVVEDLGHEVIRASDGREAFGLVSGQAPDLVVSDHMMPVLSGLDLCRKIKADKKLRWIPIILLSAALPDGTHEADAFLAKPFELVDFEKLVLDVLSQSTLKTKLAARPLRRADGGSRR